MFVLYVYMFKIIEFLKIKRFSDGEIARSQWTFFADFLIKYQFASKVVFLNDVLELFVWYVYIVKIVEFHIEIKPRVENICLSEGPVLVIAIFQVEMHRDLELQMHRDFLN